MSKEAFQAFLAHVERSEGLQASLREAKPGTIDLVTLGKTHGYAFTSEDTVAGVSSVPDCELDDDALDSVVGGTEDPYNPQPSGLPGWTIRTCPHCHQSFFGNYHQCPPGTFG
jgi:predicted ribosomally synthesized peptide with nif11-like leader